MMSTSDELNSSSPPPNQQSALCCLVYIAQESICFDKTLCEV